MEIQQKVSLWKDAKFLWLVASVALVAVFEFLSLMGEGYKLRRDVALPFFAAIILAVGWRTLWNGFKALTKLNFRSINLLMTIAVVGAFYLGEYEEAAVVIVLFALGERLESFGIQSSKSALQALVDRTPKTALIRRENQELELTLEEIKVGDILIIKPSDMIALDAEVLSGASSVDESTITGEPLPKDKHTGDKIFAGTLNMQGYLEGKVLKTAKDTTLAKIIETTFAATKTKAETQKFIETFASYYTPSIIVIAALLVAVPTLIFGSAFNPWFEQAITILVIACHCALVISTPISIYAAIGNASAKGALVKGGKYIEAIGQIKAVAMDKTRTLTYGKPKVTDVIPFGESFGAPRFFGSGIFVVYRKDDSLLNLIAVRLSFYIDRRIRFRQPPGSDRLVSEFEQGVPAPQKVLQCLAQILQQMKSISYLFRLRCAAPCAVGVSRRAVTRNDFDFGMCGKPRL